MPTDISVPTESMATVRADPIAVANRVRPGAWAVRTEEGLVVLDHKQCEAALQHDGLLPGLSRLIANMGLSPEEMTGGGHTMLLSEGEKHTALRRVVGRWFTPRRVDALAVDVRALVDRLLDPFIANGGGDFLDEVARRIPGVVFCRLIGADPTNAGRFADLAAVMLQAFDGDPELAGPIFEAAIEMHGLVEDVLASKRANPGDDLLSIMLAGVDAGELSLLDVHAMVTEMLGASTDTTSISAGLGVWTLAGFPDQWAKVVADPSLAAGAVEETLRVAPTVEMMRLAPAGPTELAGVPIAAEEMVMLSVTAAHHDPAIYPDPEVFDVTRAHVRPTLTFGIGRHYCLGAALARMELRVVLEALAARCPNLQRGGELELKISDAKKPKAIPIAITA